MAGAGNRRIVFSTGKTAGEEYPTEAGAQSAWMRDYFTEEEIPKEHVILEEESFDTAGNVEAMRNMVDKGLIGGVHLLTVWYHGPRLRKLAERYKLPVIGASASDKVVGRSALAVPDLRGSSHYWGRLVLREARERRSARPVVRAAAQLGLEAVANTLIIADPSGDGISRLATARLRHRNS